MAEKLAGKVALVTGSGKRLGRAIALELAAAGADIVVHVNRSASEGEETASAVRELGRRATVVKADQRRVGEIELACSEAFKAFENIDILVNSAAIWPKADLEQIREEDFNLAIEANLRGPFFWAKCLGTSMRRHGGGSIVNIIDATAGNPSPDALPYYAAKAAMLEMTYGLAKAFAPTVRVNAIGPGPVLFPPDYTEAQKKADRDRTLLGREGDPSDIARAVRFLCEEQYITGIMLPVDGGFRFGV